MNRAVAHPIPVGQRRPSTWPPSRQRALVGLVPVLLFLFFHIPLALLMYEVAEMATLHALATLAVGLFWAASGRRVERVAYVGAYIVGAEVLWRMTEAQIFWEFGKYATVFIFILAMLRRGRLMGPLVPFSYFLLLIPSALLAVEGLDWEVVRRDLSFNLSGPFALMVSAWFFSHLKLSPRQLGRLFLALIGPVGGICSIALYTIFTASSIQFSGEGNIITSGGFGPNQVSASLGLGALMAFHMYVVGFGGNRSLRPLLLGLMILFAAQSALTFSRGGLFMAVGSAVAASTYLLRSTRSRIRVVFVAVVVLVVTNFILLPRLDAFTGGALVARFQDLSGSGREEILQADLQIWQENPVLGVGPGKAKYYRQLFYRSIAAHTEFSRLLAEHGVFGLVALALLLIAAVQIYRRARSAVERALVVSLLCWSLLFMLINAMRLVAPSFLFGLAFVTLLPEKRRAASRVRDRRLKMEQR